MISSHFNSLTVSVFNPQTRHEILEKVSYLFFGENFTKYLPFYVSRCDTDSDAKTVSTRNLAVVEWKTK